MHHERNNLTNSAQSSLENSDDHSTNARNEQTSRPEKREIYISPFVIKSLGVLAAFGVLAGGGAIKYNNSKRIEALNSELGMSVKVDGDDCVEILPGARIRPEADARDMSYTEVGQVAHVDETLQLCGLQDVDIRLKNGAGRTDHKFIGMPVIAYEDAGLSLEDSDALLEGSETGYAWVLQSDETADIVDRTDLTK